MSKDTSKPPNPEPSPLKRALIVAGVVVVVAWGSKLYRDQKRLIDGPDPQSVAELLSSIHDRATKRSSPSPLTDLRFERPCPAPPTARKDLVTHPSWSELLPEELEELEYEILSRASKSHLTWIARRDSDCDGLYETHTLRAPRTSGGDRTGDVAVQNLGE